jgi:predicted small lipoprotein YifL
MESSDPPVTPRPIRLFLLLAAAALAHASCGRRGPLELPPDVQARGDALKAEQEAARAKTARNAPKSAQKPIPGQAQPEPPAPPIPGTIGNRPPDQYPFPLDPLL